MLNIVWLICSFEPKAGQPHEIFIGEAQGQELNCEMILHLHEVQKKLYFANCKENDFLSFSLCILQVTRIKR